MKQKKLVALGMAAAMMMSSSLTIFAADATEAPATGSAVGGGTIEGFVDKDIFTVTLPTISDVDFKLDPQELLKAVNSSAKLDNAALTAGYGDTILFVDGSNYLSKSKALTIVNKSTFDVDVKVDAKLSGLTKGDASATGYAIDVVENVTGDAATAISMKLTPTNVTSKGSKITTGAAITGTALTADEAGISVTNTIKKAADADKAYKVTGTTGNYTYAINAASANAVSFNAMSYNLSGEVNDKADWTNFSKDTNSALKVEITYTVTKSGDTSVAKTAYILKNQASTNYPIIGIKNSTADGGITNLSKVTNVKVDGVARNIDTKNSTSTTTNIFILKKTVSAGNVITFDYDGQSYTITK